MLILKSGINLLGNTHYLIFHERKVVVFIFLTQEMEEGHMKLTEALGNQTGVKQANWDT